MPKREVSRSISQPVQLMLWGKAAGRCEFEGCNKSLWQSDVTKEQVNIAQKAHIWAFSPDGPRGNAGIEQDEINDINNLMLVCHQCHRLIDQDKKGNRYSTELLHQMKLKHEQRIELVTAIAPEKSSHVLLYGANVGSQSSVITYRKAANAMMPEFYPAESSAIELGLQRSPIDDDKDGYWELEKRVLEEQFDNLVAPRLSNGDIKHLSVFALAPQPLLILLGSILTDITAAEVYQLHREPPTWSWLDSDNQVNYEISKPSQVASIAALNISLSAVIDNSRIKNVLGDKVSIWTLTIETPHNDFLQARSHVREFRRVFRQLLDTIKSKHGHDEILHIFPAMPVSIAVEVGRTRMPKADMKFSLYDEVKSRGGFVHAFNI